MSRLSVSKAEKNSNLICIQIEDVQITYVRSKKTCTLYLVLSCRSCFEVGGVWRIEDKGGWRMVPWLVIVLDFGGSVIFLSSYNLHMSLEASRAWHENRAILITTSWTHFNCQQVHKSMLTALSTGFSSSQNRIGIIYSLMSRVWLTSINCPSLFTAPIELTVSAW